MNDRMSPTDRHIPPGMSDREALNPGHQDTSSLPQPSDGQWMEEWANPDADIPLSNDVDTGIPHTYSAREIVDALDASTPSGILDDTALPADLIAKRAARGDIPYCPPAPRKSLSLTGFRVTLLAAIPILWALAVAGVVTGFVTGVVAIIGCLAVPTVFTGGIWTWAHRPTLLHRDPYTPEDHAALQRAMADWPGRAHLALYSDRAALRATWDDRWPWAGDKGAAAAVWREPHLVGISQLIANDITSGTAWRSDLFDTHRVRIDVPATLTNIRMRAFRIWRIRADTLAPTEASDPDGAAARRYTEITDALAEAEKQLIAIVWELWDYRCSMAPINSLVDEISALNLSTERVSDDALRQLRIDGAASALERTQISDAHGELADLKANLTARLEVLHSQLHLPAAALPLVAKR